MDLKNTIDKLDKKYKFSKEKLGRTLTELHERETELTAILDSATAVFEKTTFEAAAREIFHSCKKLLGGDSGYVALINRKGDENEVLFLDQGPYECSVNPDLPMPIRGLRGEAYKHGKVIYDNNFSQSAFMKYIPEGHSQLKNVLFSPLNLHGKTMGIMGLANKPGGFNDNDARLAKTFGELAAIALLNSKNIDQLRALHAGVQQLQRCESEVEFWQTAMKVTQDILDFDCCVFYSFEHNKLTPKNVFPSDFSGKVKSYPKGQGLTGTSIEKMKTIRGNDFSAWKDEKKNLGYRLNSYMSVPIGELGVFTVYSSYKNEYNERSTELAEILAGHLNEELKRIRLEKKLKKQAIHDSLTGLYNRYYFNQIIDKEVKRAKRYHNPIGLIMIDINRFKEINDSYSHLTGDKVLMGVAKILEKSVRGSDTIIRFGGDEFLVILPETKDKAQQIINRIKDNLKKWNKEQTLTGFPIDLAIGVAFYDPIKKDKIKDCLKNADNIMYEDKRKSG